ncbi:DUF805 domain-containing protein [Roseibium sp.]|uniref:DUF805 domain-containing protein n=1 Tax=Roseibium sp. TaxID=1936156 RepID=UPI003D09EE29
MSTPPPSANIAPGPFWALMSPIGRMGRQPYWLCFFLVWVIIFIAIRLWWKSNTVIPDPEAVTLAMFMESNPLFPFLFFALQWIELAVVIKRLQDLGRSGFFALLTFVPFVNFLMVIALGIIPGQAAPNRYGPLSNSYWNKK